jgi:hypothetical protein
MVTGDSWAGQSRQVGPDGAVDRASLFFIEFLEVFGQLPIELHEPHYCSAPLFGENWVRNSDTTVKPALRPSGLQPVGWPSHVYHSYMLANLRLVLDVEVVRAAASVAQSSIGPYPSLRWSLCCKESQLVAPRSSSITPRIVVSIKMMAERSGRQCHSTYACEAIRSSHCARARISSVGARPRTSNTT